MKNGQNHVNCEVKPNFGKKQLEVKSSPIAFSIGFSQSSHTLHVLYQKNSFCVESNKTLQKCSQNPFFWSLKPFKKSPLKRIFHSRPQEKERQVPSPLSYFDVCLSRPQTFWKKSHKSKKNPQHMLHLTLFLRIPVLPPLPSHPSRWGECLILYQHT